ncbi:single-stranded DNA-binding protein [Mycoplasmatota bacterium zrk1]
MAESTSEYCKKGSTVGIKARLAMKRYQYNDEKYFTYPEIIAEKVTFINLNKNDN